MTIYRLFIDFLLSNLEKNWKYAYQIIIQTKYCIKNILTISIPRIRMKAASKYSYYVINSSIRKKYLQLWYLYG